VKNFVRRLVGTAACAAVLLVTVSSSYAIDRCKVKVDKRTGVILVDATNVGGPLLWGESSGGEINTFFNAGTCVAAGKAKRCQLADPNTLASKTSPAGCTLYLDDGVLGCSAWIAGCTPGPRRDTGAVVKDSNGLTVGIAADPNGQNVLHDESGIAMRIPIEYYGVDFYRAGSLFYTSTDCSGLILLPEDPAMVTTVTVYGGSGLYEPATTSPQNIQTRLDFYGTLFQNQTDCDNNYGPAVATFVAPNACCVPFVTSGPFGPAQSILLNFTPPFHVEVQ